MTPAEQRFISLENDFHHMEADRDELLVALQTAVDRQGFTNAELISARELIGRIEGGEA